MLLLGLLVFYVIVFAYLRQDRTIVLASLNCYAVQDGLKLRDPLALPILGIGIKSGMHYDIRPCKMCQK